MVELVFNVDENAVWTPDEKTLALIKDGVTKPFKVTTHGPLGTGSKVFN